MANNLILIHVTNDSIKKAPGQLVALLGTKDCETAGENYLARLAKKRVPSPNDLICMPVTLSQKYTSIKRLSLPECSPSTAVQSFGIACQATALVTVLVYISDTVGSRRQSPLGNFGKRRGSLSSSFYPTNNPIGRKSCPVSTRHICQAPEFLLADHSSKPYMSSRLTSFEKTLASF